MTGAVASFTIAGEARPDIVHRVLGPIAQLGLTPVRVTMRRLGDVALLGIVQDDIEPTRALIVAEKMRSIVSVSAVELDLVANGATEE